jgi:outer membrane lipopolysaccharide assembly protein LptE/RlpB
MKPFALKTPVEFTSGCDFHLLLSSFLIPSSVTLPRDGQGNFLLSPKQRIKFVRVNLYSSVISNFVMGRKPAIKQQK